MRSADLKALKGAIRDEERARLPELARGAYSTAILCSRGEMLQWLHARPRAAYQIAYAFPDEQTRDHVREHHPYFWTKWNLDGLPVVGDDWTVVGRWAARYSPWGMPHKVSYPPGDDLPIRKALVLAVSPERVPDEWQIQPPRRWRVDTE